MPSRINQRAKQIKKMFKKSALNSSQLPKLGKREYVKLIFLLIFNHFKGFKFSPLPQTAGSRVENFCETVFSGGSYFEYDNVSNDIFTFGKSTSNESFCGSNLLKSDGNRSGNESAGYSLLTISDAIPFLTLKPTSLNILEQISGVKTEITETNPSELLLRTFDMTRGSARENDYEVSITGLVHNDTTIHAIQSGKSSLERKIARAQEPWAYNEEDDIPGLKLVTEFCYEPSLSSLFEMEKLLCFQKMDAETMVPTLNRYLPDTPVQSPLPFNSGDYISLLESEALVETTPLGALSAQVMEPKQFRLRQSRGSCTINTRVWQDSDSEEDDIFDAEHYSCDSANSVIIDNSKHQTLLFSNIKTIFDDFYMPLVEL